MATLNLMPPLTVTRQELAPFGLAWMQNGERLSRTPPYSSGELGRMFDNAVALSLAVMLGEIPIVTPNANMLIPSLTDCVEVGNVRVVGGVCPQNFDVGYRPDGFLVYPPIKRLLLKPWNVLPVVMLLMAYPTWPRLYL